MAEKLPVDFGQMVRAIKVVARMSDDEAEAGAGGRGWRMEKQQLPIRAHLGKLILLLWQ
jgi:hypothetical protein